MFDLTDYHLLPPCFTSEEFFLQVSNPLALAIYRAVSFADPGIRLISTRPHVEANRVDLMLYRETGLLFRKQIVFYLRTRSEFDPGVPLEVQYEGTDCWHWRAVFGIYSSDRHEIFQHQERHIEQSKGARGTTLAGLKGLLKMIGHEDFQAWLRKYE